MQFLCAPTLLSPQPRPHPKSKKRHRGQPESTGTTGQLPCKERTSVLGLNACQERGQRRDRFAGLAGTSRCREQAVFPTPAELKHLAPCSSVGTAQLWVHALYAPWSSYFWPPNFLKRSLLGEGYLHIQSHTLVLTSYFNRVYP